MTIQKSIFTLPRIQNGDKYVDMFGRTQNIPTQRSATARLTRKKFVTVRMRWWAATTTTTSEFPVSHHTTQPLDCLSTPSHLRHYIFDSLYFLLVELVVTTVVYTIDTVAHKWQPSPNQATPQPLHNSCSVVNYVIKEMMMTMKWNAVHIAQGAA